MQPCKYNKFTIGEIISELKMTPKSKERIMNSLIFKDYILSPKYNNFWLSVYYNLIQLKLSEKYKTI